MCGGGGGEEQLSHTQYTLPWVTSATRESSRCCSSMIFFSRPLFLLLMPATERASMRSCLYLRVVGKPGGGGCVWGKRGVTACAQMRTGEGQGKKVLTRVVGWLNRDRRAGLSRC